MQIIFKALASDTVDKLREGAPDANGFTPERHPAPANGAPCRHCLKDIPEGEELLVLNYRPFDTLQPYAETGPIFLCAHGCERHPETTGTPDLFKSREQMLLKGYDANDWIVYSTCRIVSSDQIAASCKTILSNPEVAYIHIRSSTANCYQCRVERG